MNPYIEKIETLHDNTKIVDIVPRDPARTYHSFCEIKPTGEIEFIGERLSYNGNNKDELQEIIFRDFTLSFNSAFYVQTTTTN